MCQMGVVVIYKNWGEWHADAEAELLKIGCKQKDIWGGGYDKLAKRIETIALINIRPRQNNDSQEILDAKIRKRFAEIVKEKFNLWKLIWLTFQLI